MNASRGALTSGRIAPTRRLRGAFSPDSLIQPRWRVRDIALSQESIEPDEMLRCHLPNDWVDEVEALARPTCCGDKLARILII